MADKKLRKHAERRIEEDWGMYDSGVCSPSPEQIAAWMLMTASEDEYIGNEKRAAKLRMEAYEILSENHPATFPFRLGTPTA